jgi:hypothetical protein
MSHFRSGCDAIVISSYADEFGGDNTDSYTIRLEEGGISAWYYEHQLTLIKSDQYELLAKWKQDTDDLCNLHSQIEWIFNNSTEVIGQGYGSSMATLGKMLGCDNLWGFHGEGWTFYQNCAAVMSHAVPFLLSGDLDGWTKYCDEFVAKRSK